MPKARMRRRLETAPSNEVVGALDLFRKAEALGASPDLLARVACACARAASVCAHAGHRDACKTAITATEKRLNESIVEDHTIACRDMTERWEQSRLGYYPPSERIALWAVVVAVDAGAQTGDIRAILAREAVSAAEEAGRWDKSVAHLVHEAARSLLTEEVMRSLAAEHAKKGISR